MAEHSGRVLSPQNQHYNNRLLRIRNYLGGEQYVKSESGGGGMRVPRFGLLSLMAPRVPMYLFDNPAMQAQFPFTAFTDGTNVFMDLALFKHLHSREKKGMSGRMAVIPWLLHELMHIAQAHSKRPNLLRLAKLDHTRMNIAEDIFIDGTIMTDFESVMEIDPFFIDTAQVKKEDFVERFQGKTEVQIFHLIQDKMDEMKKQHQQAMDKMAEALQQAMENGDFKPAQGSGSPMEGQDHPHPSGCQVVVDPQKLREFFEKNGLKEAAEKLKLPKNNEEAKQASQDERNRVERDLNKAVSKAKEAEAKGAKMAGKGYTDAMVERIDQLHDPVTQWTDCVREAVLGGGTHMDFTDDIPHDMFFLDPADLDMSEPWYDGTLVPSHSRHSTLILVDTSGSVDHEQLRLFFSEIRGAASEMSDLNRRVIIMSADTVLRGDAQTIEIDELQDVEHFDIAGRGGTNIAHCIGKGIEMGQRENWKVDSVIYFTDLEDTPPQRHELPEETPSKVVYITDKDILVEKWQQQVRGYAEVVSIAPGAEIDLSVSSAEANDASPAPGAI